jgi:hypothetical protein
MLMLVLVAFGATVLVSATPAQAKTICTIKAQSAFSSGHKTRAGAEARAWVNWQGKMRNSYGRRFAVARARVTKGYPKFEGRRFNHRVTVRAQGCYVKGVSCLTGTGITPTCECQTDRRAAQRQGCSVYAAGR